MNLFSQNRQRITQQRDNRFDNRRNDYQNQVKWLLKNNFLSLQCPRLATSSNL